MAPKKKRKNIKNDTAAEPDDKKIKVESVEHNGTAAPTAANGTSDSTVKVEPQQSPQPSAEPEPVWTNALGIRMSPVTWSDKDAGPRMKVSPDGLTITGEKGFRMARATHGFHEGSMYFEITVNATVPMKIDNKLTSPHVRVGWSQYEGDIHAPVGYDRFSYAYRDVNGAKFHESNGQTYGEQWGVGDVIGCFLILPPAANVPTTNASAMESAISQADLLLPLPKKNSKKKKHAVEEKKEITPEPVRPTISDSELTLLNAKRNLFVVGSKMVFYKNGVSQGVAFSDLYTGVYFPAISLYMGASVTVNFGPDFKYPPPCVDEVLQAEEKRHAELIEKGMPVGVLSNALAAYYYSLRPPRKIPEPITPIEHGIYPHIEGSGTMLIPNQKHYVAVAPKR